MKIFADKGRIYEYDADALIVGVYEEAAPGPDLAEIDVVLDNYISKQLQKEGFSGDTGKLRVFNIWGRIPAKNIIVVGMGSKDKLNLEVLRVAAAYGAQEAERIGAKKAGTMLFEHEVPLQNLRQKAAAIVEGVRMGLYSFDAYKKEKKNKLESFAIVSLENQDELAKSVAIGEAVGTSVNFARDMVTTPGNLMTPADVAKAAKEVGKLKGVSCRVYSGRDLKKMNLHALLAVGGGSDNDPRFIVMEYKGKGHDVALVGKGITFDTGGYNLKPSQHMEGMQGDMAGAAAVIGTIRAVAMLGLPIRLYGVIPSAENMISGHAYRPYDIIQSHSGKTIEVGNTDAEGRLVLADALSYAEKHLKPKKIIDLATLTGACVVALGSAAIGMMGTDDAIMRALFAAGEETYDRVWQLPMWEDYDVHVKSEIADVASISKKKEAGAIAGAKFLQQFVESTPWVHLDIAGPAWSDEARHYIPNGGTGAGIRLLVKYLSNLCKKD